MYFSHFLDFFSHRSKYAFNVTPSMTSCSSLNPSSNIAGLGDPYTVFQECLICLGLASITEGRSLREQRIAKALKNSLGHSYWPENCALEGKAGELLQPHIKKSMDWRACDCLRRSAMWSVLLLAIIEMTVKYIGYLEPHKVATKIGLKGEWINKI